jgi:hypothetical protein
MVLKFFYFAVSEVQNIFNCSYEITYHLLISFVDFFLLFAAALKNKSESGKIQLLLRRTRQNLNIKNHKLSQKEYGTDLKSYSVKSKA